MRPLKKKHCAICGIPHKRSKSNLCMTHRDTCPICLGHYPKSRDVAYCRQCEKSHPWLRCLRLDRHVWDILYKDSDYPLNLPKLDVDLARVPEAYEKLDRKIKEVDPHDRINPARKKVCKEFWARIPSLQSLLA